MKTRYIVGFLLALLLPAAQAATEGVRVKDLGRFDGVRDNMLVGYGIVTGLAGTGDTSRSQATLQSVVNALRDFGVAVTPSQLSSRNVAGVMVTATLPPFARSGDKLDVTVSSLGDARSLNGGTLLMMPMYGPDKRVYALAQGPLVVGGYQYDLNGNMVQRNHPTAGVITEGATIEKTVSTQIVKDGVIDMLLFDPDYTTASRVAEALNRNLGGNNARAVDPSRVRIDVPADQQAAVVGFIAKLENITVEPDQRARVVVNERTGTVVAGGDVRISKVTVTHGSLRVRIETDYLVSQPGAGGVLVEPRSSSIRTEVVPRTRIDVKEDGMNVVSLPGGTRVSELVDALNRIKTNTRDMITVLQSIKRAGALHAELIVQ
jgi:flagellar P-ring protein precursor FlgI